MATLADDLAKFHDGDLTLTVNGRKYRIPEPSITEGERIRAAFYDPTLTPQQRLDETLAVLGPVYEQAKADGVGWSHVRHMGETALCYHAAGPAVAARYWRLGKLAELADIDRLLQQE